MLLSEIYVIRGNRWITDCVEKLYHSRSEGYEKTKTSESIISAGTGIFQVLPEFQLFEGPRSHSQDSSKFYEKILYLCGLGTEPFTSRSLVTIRDSDTPCYSGMVYPRCTQRCFKLRCRQTLLAFLAS